jgi:hypothetical protein
MILNTIFSVVVNQVILASIWFLLSCASLSSTIFIQVKVLVRNFLWIGIITGRAHAKVTCEMAMQPLTHGGMKIFDPSTQARALMGKLIARRLALGREPWKLLMRHKLHDIQLQHYGHWSQST